MPAPQAEVQRLPTPKIGDSVLWYRDGDLNTAPCAAIVTAVEMPGRVKLTVFPANKYPEFYVGVRWARDQGIPASSPIRRGHGGWDYAGSPPKGAYKTFDDDVERREKARDKAAQEHADRERFHRLTEQGFDPEKDNADEFEEQLAQA